ncbi:MAG: hypothetical protein Q9157_009073, partial [Trypethelium eluteriae]
MPPGFATRVFGPDELKYMARWIRDELDPQVAREGPQALKPDDVLILHDAFTAFALNPSNIGISLPVLRYSRIHRAIQIIARKATRWPGRLIDLCDDIIVIWEQLWGPLNDVQLILYGEGGRLWHVVKPGYFTHEETVRQWKKEQRTRRGAPDILEEQPMEHGHLSFTPGQWWINQSFAFQAGIINDVGHYGGIVYNEGGAYAIVLAGSDEFNSDDPNRFWFHTKPGDKGKYRLTAADANSRYPIRILRTHTLHSPWAPKVGIRYDGLHKVTRWFIKMQNGQFVYDIYLTRMPDQRPMEEVLLHPWADEREDYAEYRRLRETWREGDHKNARQRPRAVQSSDVYDDASSGQASDQSLQEDTNARMKVPMTDNKSMKILGQPELPKLSELELSSPTADLFTIPSKSPKTVSRVALDTNGSKDGAACENKQRVRRLYDGSEDEVELDSQDTASEARSTPESERPPRNAAVEI